MSLQRVSELSAPPEIGRRYLVPVVEGRVLKRKGWWPVVGPRHEDAELINFDAQHYHLDPRFLAPGEWNCVSAPVGAWGVVGCYRHPLIFGPSGRVPKSSPEWRPRLCRRALPAYPRDLAPWLPVLEVAYADCRLTPGLVCPHRGAPLAGLPVEDGLVTCPLHGLRWNVATGELAPTVEPAK